MTLSCRRDMATVGEDVEAAVARRELDREQRWYARYHTARWTELLALVDELLARVRAQRPGEPPALLDVAIGMQTELLRARVPGGRVDDLGFTDPVWESRPPSRHVDFDLNRAADESAWPRLGPYHLVVMSEVIEHLYVWPSAVLRMLRAALVPGGFLIVQTPNAIALHKRLRMLAGRPPVAPIPEGRPGEPHLHEYTAAELVEAGRAAGLEVEHVTGSNYFGFGRGARAYRALGRVLPLSLRHGLTVAFRAP